MNISGGQKFWNKTTLTKYKPVKLMDRFQKLITNKSESKSKSKSKLKLMS